MLSACGYAMQSSGEVGGNDTEMEIMENFVRTLVEGWRYQGRKAGIRTFCELFATIVRISSSMIFLL